MDKEPHTLYDAKYGTKIAPHLCLDILTRTIEDNTDLTFAQSSEITILVETRLNLCKNNL